VLVDDDVVVYDSTIINEYLDEEYPEPAMMPEDSASRARVRLLEDFCDTSFIPPTMVVLAELHKAEEARDKETLSRYQAEIARVLARLETQLEGREYLGGGFSLADAAFAPRLLILHQIGVEIDARLTHVQAWIQRVSERPSVRSLLG